jgi:hypothetical protein
MNKNALHLPDSLLVRYYREGKDEQVTNVTTGKDGKVHVTLSTGENEVWRDLGGNLGYVPELAAD